MTPDADEIRASKLFDEAWYLERYPDVKKLGMDPIEHYLHIGAYLRRAPSPAFSPEKLDEIHREAEKSGQNALLFHIRRNAAGRQVVSEAKEPGNAVTNSPAGRLNGINGEVQGQIAKRRVAVFAAFDRNNQISPHVVFYIRALSKVASDIIFVADNPLDDRELAKIKPYITHAICGRHGEYDFGSYKRGYIYARDAGLLKTASALLLCNDSCFGPISDLGAVFEAMDARSCDFWGITESEQFNYHLQSYFICLLRSAFARPAFEQFITSVKAEKTVQDVIFQYELKLTKTLTDDGLKPAALITKAVPRTNPADRKHLHIEHFPEFMLAEGSPFIKVKSLNKANCNLNGIASTLSSLKEKNGELYNIVCGYSGIAKFHAAPKVLFSVIMPTWNRVHCIDKAIQSLLDQTHKGFELVIVDDGSSDGTGNHIKQKYAQQIASSKFIYINTQRHVGVSAARNIGVQAASHDWIAYLDSDNVLRPGALEVFAQNIIENPDRKVFYAQLCRREDGLVVGKPFDRSELLEGNYIDLGVFVHHRKCADELGSFDNRLKRLVDWDMILRYTESNDPVFIPHVLLDYSNSADANRVSRKEPGTTARLLIQSKHLPYPTVSTILLTYNQEKFIEQAIESALAQKGRIIHELIISDDGSTDGTRKIIEAYCDRYPLIVRSIGGEANVGISQNFRRSFQAASGKYIAVLEGDDYWTDEKKLDSQVTFLEENKDCSMVFSRIEVRDVTRNSTRLLKRQEKIRKDKLDGSDFLAEASMNLIGNFSCCAFRADLMKRAPAVLFRDRLSEIAVAFYLEAHGKIGYINKTMSVYRQHPNGTWTGSDKKAQLLSGLATRKIVKEVARDLYKERIQKVIDENYARPLSKL